jgi:hypothetical protein
LAWYDTNLNNFYELEAVGDSGAIYQIGRDFMSPYDFPFAQNRFWYLSNESLLVRTYGTTSNREIAAALKTVKTGREVAELEQTRGRNLYDEAKAEKFSRFIQAFFRNLNQRQAKTIFISHFGPPHHIWNFAAGNVYQMQEPVREVRVKFLKTLYDGQKIQRLDDRVIRIVKVLPAIRANFGPALTLLDCSPHLNRSGRQDDLLFLLTCDWQSRMDLTQDFELLLTLRDAHTGQVVAAWRRPLKPENPGDVWQTGKLTTVSYQLEIGPIVEGRYHLDIALQHRVDGAPVEVILKDGVKAEFVRLANIQEQLRVQ